MIHRPLHLLWKMSVIEVSSNCWARRYVPLQLIFVDIVASAFLVIALVRLFTPGSTGCGGAAVVSLLCVIRSVFAVNECRHDVKSGLFNASVDLHVREHGLGRGGAVPAVACVLGEEERMTCGGRTQT